MAHYSDQMQDRVTVSCGQMASTSAQSFSFHARGLLSRYMFVIGRRIDLLSYD